MVHLAVSVEKKPKKQKTGKAIKFEWKRKDNLLQNQLKDLNTYAGWNCFERCTFQKTLPDTHTHTQIPA